jgi:hypothetical protein
MEKIMIKTACFRAKNRQDLTMAQTVHAFLDEKVLHVLKREAVRLGISVSKAIQRAIVIAYAIEDVPVFTRQDLAAAVNDETDDDCPCYPKAELERRMRNADNLTNCTVYKSKEDFKKYMQEVADGIDR